MITEQKELFKHLYEHLDNSGKQLYQNNLNALLYVPVMNRIKTFDDAFNELREDDILRKEYLELSKLSISNDILAFLKLKIICKVLNEYGELDRIDEEHTPNQIPMFHFISESFFKQLQEKCEDIPVINIATSEKHLGIKKEYTKATCFYSTIGESNIMTPISLSLYLRTRELAVYCGRQFIDIWLDYFFNS